MRSFQIGTIAVLAIVVLCLSILISASSATGAEAKIAGLLTVSDIIQSINVLAVSVTLLVVARQVAIANKLANAQILRDRFEMYWRVASIKIDDQEVTSMMRDPDRSFLDRERFETYYKHDPERIRDYLYYGKLYEYLAFLHALKEMGVKDPLGPNWLPLWARDLASNPEFLDANDQYRPYYPKFAELVDKIKNTTK